MSQLFTSGGQSIGVSGSASVWCWRCCCWNKSKEVWERELPVAGCLWTREEWEKAGDLGRAQGTEGLDLYAVCYGEQDRHPVRFLFYSYLYKYKEWERIDSPRCDSKHSLTEVCPSGCGHPTGNCLHTRPSPSRADIRPSLSVSRHSSECGAATTEGKTWPGAQRWPSPRTEPGCGGSTHCWWLLRQGLRSRPQPWQPPLNHDSRRLYRLSG